MDTFNSFPEAVAPLFHTPLAGFRDRIGEYQAIAALCILERKPLKILRWQEACLRMLSQMDDSGTLIYRDFGISVTRQQGKSTLLALIIIHHMLTRPDAFVLSIGGGVTTARVSFDITRKIIEGSPDLEPYFETGRDWIRCSITKAQFTYRAPNRSTLGLSPTLLLADERLMLADKRGDEALASVRASQGAIDDALFISTSTVGDNKAWETQWGAEFRRGEKLSLSTDYNSLSDEDKKFGFVHYGLSSPDDIEDTEKWITAAPALVDGLGSLSEMKSALVQAEETGQIHQFAMYRLGIWQQGIQGEQAAFDMQGWYQMASADTIIFSEDEPIMLGLDASYKNDHTALVAVSILPNSDGKYKVKTLWVWKPEDNDDFMPVDELMDVIEAFMSAHNAYLAFDEYLVIERMMRFEKTPTGKNRLFNVKQSVERMSPAGGVVMQKAASKQYIFEKNDPIHYYAGNTILKENKLLAKPSRMSQHKVDGIVALVIAEYQISQVRDRIMKKQNKTSLKIVQ